MFAINGKLLHECLVEGLGLFPRDFPWVFPLRQLDGIGAQGMTLGSPLGISAVQHRVGSRHHAADPFGFTSRDLGNARRAVIGHSRKLFLYLGIDGRSGRIR